MKMAGYALAVVAVLAAALSVWVRLAPSDPDRWHAMPGAITNRDLTGGAMRVTGAGEDGLARLDQIIRATLRTKVLAGSVGEGIITYITRSAVMGFPDYTTLRLNDKQIELYGRQRFGKSDFGVNAARLDGWLVALRQGG